ncbi:ABC transporter ATP-binding protein [Nocardia anaemiae]|uniref:ABC transporter ATP-binding protein n=1 Tax=Nocardia anaemiae TaxID=263910 RepID=UPI000B0E3617|nr:ATP-binding cassette domain-containing protein [Nocardia anaemiae]
MPETPVLRLTDVTFRREGKQIIDGISLTVHAGEHWALLGPNGAGKSTLLGFCAAVTFPTSGTVDILGQRMGRVDLAPLRHAIGHVNPRHPLRYSLTVREVVLTGITATIDTPMRWTPTPEDLCRADAMIDTVGLEGKAEEIWPTLSQGERGRTLIARALIAEPRLLLFDEPSTGLDVAAREQLLETIDALGETHPEVASILVTHHLEELPSTTTHALLIADGRTVAAGPAAETVTTDTVSAAFDHPVAVRYDDGRWSVRAWPTQQTSGRISGRMSIRAEAVRCVE